MSGSETTGRFARWAFEEYAPRELDLAIFRVIYAAYGLLIALPNLDRVADFGDVDFRPPPGPMRLLETWPTSNVMTVLELVLAVGLGLLLIGWRTSWVSPLTTVAWLAALSVLFSTGKIAHAHAVFTLIPLFLGPAGWGNRLSVDARRDRSGPVRAWPLALLATTVALMLFTAARPKIEAGWLNTDAPAVRRIFIDRVFLRERASPTAEWMLDNIISGLLWEIIDWATISLELGLVVLVLRRRWWMAGLAFATVFHTSIHALLDIDFAAQVVAYGAFVRWGGFIPASRTPATTPRWQSTRRVLDNDAVALAIGGLIGWMAVTRADSTDVALGSLAWGQHEWINSAVLYVAATLAMAWMLGRTLQRRKSDEATAVPPDGR